MFCLSLAEFLKITYSTSELFPKSEWLFHFEVPPEQKASNGVAQRENCLVFLELLKSSDCRKVQLCAQMRSRNIRSFIFISHSY